MSDTALPLRAEYNAKFYRRPMWLGIGMFAFMLYCVYDGYYTWPDQKVRGEALMELADEELSREEKEKAGEGGYGPKDAYVKIVKGLEDYPGLSEAWSAKAEAEGWPAKPPKKLRSDGDIVNQYVMAGLAGAAALWFGLSVALARGGWIELDESGVSSRRSGDFAFNQVTAIDKKQWRDKGIARVRYESAGGGQKTFVVDNYKFDRKVTDRILYEIEQRAGVDKIVNGGPDEDPDKPATSADSPGATASVEDAHEPASSEA